jgi:hypothetical protein
MVGDIDRLPAGGVGQVACGVFAAEHRPGGQVDRLQRLLPARCRLGFAAQYLAAEIERGIAPRLGEIRRHRVAHPPAQVGLPLRRLQSADQRIEPGEQRRVGDRHRVVADALHLEKGVQLQVAVLLAEARGGHRREVRLRVAQFHQRAFGCGDALLEVEHQRGFAFQVLGRDPGQGQDLADVVGVTRQQGLGVGIAARVVGRVGQAQAALREIAEMAIQLAQVDVGAEVEQRRDADLVQRGDRRGDVAGLADAVDPLEQRRDRIGAVAFDRGFVQAARPEIAQQFLHVALRRVHRRIEQVALLLLRARGELAERGNRAAVRHRVRLQPVRVRIRVEIRTGRRRRRRLRLLRRGFLRGMPIGCGKAGGEGEDQGKGKRARCRHASFPG